MAKIEQILEEIFNKVDIDKVDFFLWDTSQFSLTLQYQISETGWYF
jgi:uncharacterized protein involved in type VI secretion and phage assembly